VSNGKIAEAMSLLDAAERELHKVRLETSPDYFDDDEAHGAVTMQMRKIDEDYLIKARMLISAEFENILDPALDEFRQRLAVVDRTFEYIAGEKNAGRLPQLKEAPWPPAEWVAEENMRADAAEGAAEDEAEGEADA
jgi:hypothetical protein